MSGLVRCQNCKKIYPDNFAACPHCSGLGKGRGRAVEEHTGELHKPHGIKGWIIEWAFHPFRIHLRFGKHYSILMGAMVLGLLTLVTYGIMVALTFWLVPPRPSLLLPQMLIEAVSALVGVMIWATFVHLVAGWNGGKGKWGKMVGALAFIRIYTFPYMLIFVPFLIFLFLLVIILPWHLQMAIAAVVYLLLLLLIFIIHYSLLYIGAIKYVYQVSGFRAFLIAIESFFLYMIAMIIIILFVAIVAVSAFVATTGPIPSFPSY